MLRGDRVRLLASDAAFSSLRPCDMNLDYDNAQRIFNQAQSATSASSALVDELGFHLYNPGRGGVVQLHRLHQPLSLLDVLEGNQNQSLVPTRR